MPNDTLDEIEARWKHALRHGYNVALPLRPWHDIRTLIEMVRARDKRLQTIARAADVPEHKRTDTEFLHATAVICREQALAALDTPPAQEPTE